MTYQTLQQVAGWRQAIVMTGLLCLALMAMYSSTVIAMVNIWWRSETFAHGFIILPITLFLVWRLRNELRLLRPQPTLLGLPMLALLGAAWLLAEFASVAVVQQLALVLMLSVAVFSMLGWTVTRRMLFPLFFLVFAVPMGEDLIPPLMDFTADFTVYMLQVSGIPVYREGLFFEIPSGHWSVVEGCSGVRYLIASVTLGCLYAYLTYTSLLRRIIFIAASFVVPVIANGMRAYMIVMIAHYSDYKLAMGVDHFIYGWVWFGMVILLMFWIGSYWRQEPHRQVMGENSASVMMVSRPSAVVLAAVLSVTLLWPLWAKISDSTANRATVSLTAPENDQWHRTAVKMTDWQPRYLGTDAELMQSYEHDDNTVSLYLGYYREQRQDAELVNSQNVLVRQKHPVWRQVNHGQMRLQINGRDIDVWTGRLRASHGQNLEVIYWHWLGGRYTINPYFSKLLDARAKLLGQPRDGAVILLATDLVDGDTDKALGTLQQFATAMLPGIQKQLNAIAGY